MAMVSSDDERDLVHELVTNRCPASRSREEQDVADLLLSSQDSIDHALSADACRSETETSGSEDQQQEGGTPDSGFSGSSSASPIHHVKTTSWWAPLLKGYLAGRAKQVEPLLGQDVRAKKVLSACSGSCAEAEVLKVA